MKTLLKHSVDVAIERRSRLVMGVVREVGRGDGSDGRIPAGMCAVQIPGEAAGGQRAIVSAMLPAWSSGIGYDIRPDDYVLVLLSSTAGEVATIVWRFPSELAGAQEVLQQDHPAARSSTGKLEGAP